MFHLRPLDSTESKDAEPVFLKVNGAHESIHKNEFASLCSLAGRYDNPIPTRFLAPIDCLKILALVLNPTVCDFGISS